MSHAMWSRCLVLLVFMASAAAALGHPGAVIAVGAGGRVYFVDTGAGVFSIDQKGSVLRREGPAFHWFALDPPGRFRKTPWPSIPDAEFRSADVDPTLVLSSDFPVAIGTNAIFYYPQGSRDRGVRIVGIAPSGSQSVRATLPAIRSGGKPVWWLNGLAAGPGGSLYYTEDRAVRRVDAQGRVSEVAAVVSVPNCVAIPGIGPELRPYLRGLAVARDGSVYVAASGCGAVLKIDPTGRTSTVLRTQPPWSPTAVAISNGEIYVLEYSHTASDDRREWIPRVRKVSRTGAVVMLGGSRRR